MADDFERLCETAGTASAKHCMTFGPAGAAVSVEHGRAIVLAVLREGRAIAQTYLDAPIGSAPPADEFLDDLIAQAEGEKR